MGKGVLIAFTVLGVGALALAGIDLLVEGHLPLITLALGGGAIVLTIGSQL